MQKSVFIALLLAFFAPIANAQVAPTPGMKITAATEIKPGEYKMEGGGIQVSGANFTLELSGVQLIGAGKRLGVGIHITDARNVTIKNAYVSGFLWGIIIERSANITLEGCTTNFNSDLPPGTVIDESGNGPEDQWGGGILLRDSTKCHIRRCKSMYQWDGIDVIRSNANIIENGDFSFNGNWGVHFWDSGKNIFRNNRAVWCTTGAGKLYQALTGWQTYDAQAVGIDHNSCENLIEKNDLRFGGDGIFIRANEGPITPGTIVPVKNGSQRNILRGNDCSFSPNNAIEVDLVDDTVIENNDCSNSHYGMWLGYSKRCIIKGNLCVDDTANAVEIENGSDDIFESNRFGVSAASRGGQLVYLRQNDRDKTPSGGYVFKKNQFWGTPTAVLLRKTSAAFEANQFVASIEKAALVKGDPESRITETGSILGTLPFKPNGPEAKDPAPKYFNVSTPQPDYLRRAIRIAPKIAKPGETVEVSGKELNGGRILLNGKPVALTVNTAETLKFVVPDDIKPGTKINVLWERGEGPDYVRDLPVTLEIVAPK